MKTLDDRGSIFREHRAAKTQSLFRLVNERIEPLNETFSSISRINGYVCECADETCTEPIGMSVGEYEAIRARGNRFAIAPGDSHVWPDVERITEKRDRYWVVEKHGYASALAERLDPRADDWADNGELPRPQRPESRAFDRPTASCPVTG